MKYIKVVAFVSSFFFFFFSPSTASSKAFESFPSTPSLDLTHFWLFPCAVPLTTCPSSHSAVTYLISVLPSLSALAKLSSFITANKVP